MPVSQELNSILTDNNSLRRTVCDMLDKLFLATPKIQEDLGACYKNCENESNPRLIYQHFTDIERIVDTLKNDASEQLLKDLNALSETLDNAKLTCLVNDTRNNQFSKSPA